MSLNKAEKYNRRNAEILEMIAIGRHAPEIYDAIALLYEERHPGMRCSMLELHENKLLHGGAPSLPEAYCDAIDGLEYGPAVGSCGTSTYTGQRVIVEDIASDPKWKDLKHFALQHGLRSCWSEPIKNSSGKVLGAFGMYYNHPALPDKEESEDLLAAGRLAGIVMERDQAQKRIKQLAYTDQLTGLFSRAYIYEILEDIIARSKEKKIPFGILYLDLDNFKHINDSLGHDTGDLLLIEIAHRLMTIDNRVTYVARLGGDEFCLVIEEMTDPSTLQSIAGHCIREISKPAEISLRRITPTCSIGIACFPDNGANVPMLMKAADTALYAAKDQGKNRCVLYHYDLTKKAEYRFQIEQYLREAIDKQQLSLVYQPQINIMTGKVTSVEALVRWHHAELGNIPPSEFIPIAEHIGMMHILTEWVLYTACSQAMTWNQSGFPDLRMAINISPRHFCQEEIVPLVNTIITSTGVMPKHLELEVTESVMQTDESNLTIIDELKKIGIRLAIDDFGTGYSSFASLKHFDADCIKIDKCFLDDILTDTDSSLLVGSMIDIGHNLRCEIVAEGIETAEQLSIVKNMGCDTAQGYLFSEPVNSEDVTKILQHQFAVS